MGEEEEYDALNDETFGSEATIGDWEQDHEKLAEITESSRPYHQDNQNIKVCMIFLTKSLSFPLMIVNYPIEMYYL